MPEEKEIIRCFFAITFEKKIQQQLINISDHLKQQCPARNLRWVPTENLHITLKFLGNTEKAQLPELIEQTTTALATTAPFSLKLHSPHLFPNENHPKVIALQATATTSLIKLAEILDQTAVGLGFPPATHAFREHLTLARIKEGQVPKLTELQHGKKIKTTINSLSLMQSETKLEGAVYSSLHEFSLLDV